MPVCHESKKRRRGTETDTGFWNPVQGPKSGGRTVKRLTTAYEREWVDGRKETVYVPKASDLEITNRLGAYEDAEEEGRLFVVPCKPGDMVFVIIVDEIPSWNCYIRGIVVQDVSAKQVKYADDWADWDTPGVYTDKKAAEAKARQLRKQRNRLKSHTVNEYGWIPVAERLPENDDYVLMSFENFSLPLTGRYVDDEELGGAWYVGDCYDEDTCLANDLFVNAWMPLPKPYREDDENGNIS